MHADADRRPWRLAIDMTDFTKDFLCRIHGHTGMPADVSPTLAPRRAGLSNVQAPQKGRKWS